MSSSLYWSPIVKREHLENNLKNILKKRNNKIDKSTLTYSDIPYLEGLQDSGIRDAEKLIDGINKYDQILLIEEF